MVRPVQADTQEPLQIRSLVGHRESVEAGTPLEAVHKRFAENGRDFMAVLDGDRLAGVCARREIAMKLGARFGFALFARSPVREHLSPNVLTIVEGLQIREVLESVSARAEAYFYDDVLLSDAAGGFVGFIFVHELVRLQTRLLLGNISALERSRREIAEKNKAMEDDLRMARDVQLAMLPEGAGATEAGRGWEFHSHYAPAGGVSGDFFQVIPVSEHAAGVLVCDVMGHGVRSALVTAMIRAFTEELRPMARDPGALLTRLNAELSGVLQNSGTLLFVTAAYVIVDAADGSLNYAQAGHPTGFVRRASGRVEPLPMDDDGAGPALGLIADCAYASRRGRMGPGDAAILYTDGLTEARAASGEEWGEGRLMAELGAHPSRATGELLPGVVAAAGAFAGGGPFEDDVCLVSLGLAAAG
jgi:serine phosphatase RsbU (regulator of sigma subunit)